MDFRQTLSRAAGAAAFAALVAAGPALAADPILLKFSAGSSSIGNMCKGQIDDWAKRVETQSTGRIKVEIVCDGVLSKNGDTASRVAAGIVDMGWDIPALYGKRFVGLSMTGLPGVFRDAEDGGGALYRAYETGLLGKQLDEFKVIWLQAVGNNGIYMREPLKSHTNLTGIKLAVESKPKAVTIEGMNGIAIALNTSDYYQALQKGVVDGTMTSPGGVQANKLQEVLHYYLFGPFGGGTTMVLMNKGKYESLPADLKKVIDDNSGYAQSRKVSAFLRDFEANTMAKDILSAPGNKGVDMTDAEIAAWQPAYDKTIADWLATTEGGKDMLDGYRKLVAAEVAKGKK